MEPWRIELRGWAQSAARDFAQRDGILGVLVGGSLARGQEWQHSDLELGLLVAQRITPEQLPYFNVIGGRGVEAIQLVQTDLEAQVRAVEGGDLAPLLAWPIQLWRGRIVHDPGGLLGRFKAQFDANLFRSELVDGRVAALRGKIDKSLGEARALLGEDRPAAALVRARSAMNEAILAFTWRQGQLPRSQNRTDSRLHGVCRRAGDLRFYQLYREVFDLGDAARVIRTTWPAVRAEVLELTRLWGETAKDFFEFAVDGEFAWRQNAGILTVYRLYVPAVGAPEKGILMKLDDPAWACAHGPLLRFLGLDEADKLSVNKLIDQIQVWEDLV